jgi:regulator of sirC expression with transglutaminase-like and TPR domain
MRQGINTLISLLEDNDTEVLGIVKDELLKQGTRILPQLEKAWENSMDPKLQERLENLIHHIQFTTAKAKLMNWVSDGAGDLLLGATYVAQFQYPGVDYHDLNKSIDLISRDIYLSDNKNLSAVDKVKLLNYVIYELNNFTRNTSNFYSPQNSFINQVIETRKGNPISLGVIYLAVARKLKLPIFGVNLPKSFILAYMNEYRHYESPDITNDILFYINPYNKGTILNKKEIDHFIHQQNLKPESGFYSPCDNKSIILRMITNLIIAYQKLGFPDKIKLLEEILKGVNKTEYKQ